MNNYETLFIVRQEASATQVEAIVDELVALLDEKGGKLARRENWGLRTLAYRIRKSRKGHYILLNYESESEAVDALQYRMRYSNDVVRYMTIRTEDLPTDASVQMRTADGDDDAKSDGDKHGKRDSFKKDKGYRPRRKTSADNDESEAISEAASDAEATPEAAPETAGGNDMQEES